MGHFQRGCAISCIQHPETGREVRFGTLQITRRPKSVMVIGGGPGGLKAAAVAAERGHRVTLYEAASRVEARCCWPNCCRAGASSVAPSPTWRGWARRAVSGS